MWTDGAKPGFEKAKKKGKRVGRRGVREKRELGSVKQAHKVSPSIFMSFRVPYGAAVPLKEHSAAKALPV